MLSHEPNEETVQVLRVERLLKQIPLDEKNCDHPLSGDWMDHRECHVKPDILLIYKSDKEKLFLERLGLHPEIFK